MSLSKQQKFKPGSKERRILDSFGSILPRDAESRIYQLKSNGVVITVTVIVEGIVGLMLYENQKGRFRIHETTSIANLLELFKPHERECFFNVICRLALVQTQGHILNHLELSNQLLQKGYGCLGDVNLFGLINERTEHQPLEYSDPAATNSFTFVHIHVQHFLAAINLLKIPPMEIFHFLKNHTLAEHDSDIAKNSSTVLRFFFGLAGTVFGEGSTALLQNVLKYLTQYINRDAPVIDSKVSVLILNCLYEAQNTSLYRQVQNETFTRQIFSFDIKVIEDNLEPFAHYLFNTSEPRLPTWTIYCSNKQKNIVNALVKKVTEMKGPAVNMKTNTKLTATDNRRVIISNKNTDYLISVLSDISLDRSSESSITSRNRKDSVLSETSSSSSDTVSPDRQSSLDQQVIERSSIRSDTAMLSAASISIDMVYLHSDIGEIGCDYLMTDNQVKDEIKWRNMTTFDISCDQQIGRELPLPSKKGTESAEITTSTAKANVKDGTAAQKNTNYAPTLPDAEGPDLKEDIRPTAVIHETDVTERPTGPSLEYPMSTSLYDEVEWERIPIFNSSFDELICRQLPLTVNIVLPGVNLKVFDAAMLGLRFCIGLMLIFLLYQFVIVDSTQQERLPLKQLTDEVAQLKEVNDGDIINETKTETFDKVIPTPFRYGIVEEQESLDEGILIVGNSKGKEKIPSSHYAMNQQGNHGYALIINNINFNGKEERKGAVYDGPKIANTLRNLGYQLVDNKVHTDRTAYEMEQLIEEAMAIDHTHNDSFICVLMSHGESNGIFGIDDQLVNLNDIINKVSACETLSGKPKIFIVQACRGGTQTDLPQNDDVFIGFATSSNMEACRFTNTGSWYITELCNALEQYPFLDLEQIMTIVRNNVFSKPEYIYRRKDGKEWNSYRQSPHAIGTERKIYLTREACM